MTEVTVPTTIPLDIRATFAIAITTTTTTCETANANRISMEQEDTHRETEIPTIEEAARTIIRTVITTRRNDTTAMTIVTSNRGMRATGNVFF